VGKGEVDSLKGCSWIITREKIHVRRVELRMSSTSCIPHWL
jgi:hypothetical protein